MDLEQRVQVLEQELEVLKNQIQATLLEIQGQLSTNTYPSLRAEETPSSPRSTTSAPPTGRPAYRQLSTDAIRAESPDDHEEPPSLVRKVSLNALAADEPAQMAAPLQQSSEITEWSTLEELEQWTSQKVKEIGIGRTRKLIELHSQKGLFSDDVKDILLQFVSLYEDEMPPHNRGSNTHARQPAPSRPASQKPAVRKQPAPTRPQPPAAPKPASQPAARKQAASAKRTEPAKRQQPAESSEATPNGEAEDETNSSVVLRLIAGVQNAGAGVKWRKPHG